jgi:hypothetical protein
MNNRPPSDDEQNVAAATTKQNDDGMRSRLEAAIANIKKLAEVVPASELIYQPANLQDLTAEEFGELMRVAPDFEPQAFGKRFEALTRLQGVYVKVTSAWGTRPELSNRAADELARILNSKNPQQ